MGVDVDALYRRYSPMVLRRCRGLLGLEEEAVDAMQDVFVQVIRHRDRLTSQAPSSLLYRIATRVCLNRIRTRRRRPESPGSAVLWTLATAAEGLEAQAQGKGLLRRLFAHQPDSSATIAVLHLLDGLSHEEVASIVGLSVSGVRKRLRKLRSELLSMTGDEAVRLANALGVAP